MTVRPTARRKMTEVRMEDESKAEQQTDERRGRARLAATMKVGAGEDRDDERSSDGMAKEDSQYEKEEEKAEKLTGEGWKGRRERQA